MSDKPPPPVTPPTPPPAFGMSTEEAIFVQRRSCIRVPVWVDVNCRLVTGHRLGSSSLGTMIDIGAGGCRIMTEVALTPQRHMELTFNLDEAGAFKLISRCMWYMGGRAGERLTSGMRFERLIRRDEARIVKFVNAVLAAQRRER